MIDDWPDFRFRRLDAYKAALELAVRADRLRQRIRRRWPAAAGQMERHSLSVLLNTAEGAGDFSPGDKARFYRMALRSGTETASALEFIAEREPALRAEAREAAQLCFRVVSMLHKLMPRQLPPDRKDPSAEAG